MPEAWGPVFSHAADAFLILDEGLRVLTANPAAERLLGGLTGSALPPALAAAAAEPYSELQLATASGPVPVSILCSPVPGPGGKAHHLMAIRDLTEQHRLRQVARSNLQQVAMMQERERLAREFHDGLAQTLAYLNIQASQLDQALARGDTATARTQLGELRLVIQSAYRDVRHALYDLRVTLEQGLGPALEAYCHSFGLRNNLDVHYTGTATGSGCLGPDQSAQVLRIVQEALTNVRKHALAQTVWVALGLDGDRLTVTVRDNGVGFVVSGAGLNAAKPGHYGLATMHERAAGVGGRLTVRSEPGGGTEIELTVPCGCGAPKADKAKEAAGHDRV